MTYYKDDLLRLYNGDCMEVMRTMENSSINKIITSPPYNIVRPNSTDRGYDLYQDGMSNENYVTWIVSIFREYDRILAPNGCVCFNLSYGTENTEVMNLTVAEIIKQTNFTLADILVWKKKKCHAQQCVEQ